MDAVACTNCFFVWRCVQHKPYVIYKLYVYSDIVHRFVRIWCVCVCVCVYFFVVVLCCLSLAAFPHYCTYPGVTCRNGRECPLVVHYWAALQSLNGFRCYDNIAPNAKSQNVSQCLYSLYAWSGNCEDVNRRILRRVVFTAYNFHVSVIELYHVHIL